jgi:hypothetical protein
MNPFLFPLEGDMRFRVKLSAVRRLVLSCAAVLAVLALGASSGCGTLAVTEEPSPKLPQKPIPARLGVHVSGEALKKVFSDADRRKVGLAAGQYFSDIVLLPPATRYIAPQDIRDQFGVDLILQLQMADTKTSGELNPYFFLAMPMAWFEVLAPIVSYEVTVDLEANLRDARTGKLLWAKTQPTRATNQFSPVAPEQKVAGLAELGLRTAIVKVFEEIRPQLASYELGKAAKPEVMASNQPTHPVAPQANRYAIVVGIEQYRERIPKADFAAQDAKDIAQFLTQQAGYREENVIVRLNEQATKSDLEKYFEAWLKNNLDASSSLLIYFSGHGAPEAATGDAYLVPYDGDPAFIEQTGYPLKRLYQTLDKLPTRNIIVMLDSCFSGAGGRSVLAKGARPMVLTVEGLASSSKAVVLAATSGSHLSLADQEKGHGLFTYYALQGMGGEADANGDGAIDVQELFEYLKPQVQRVARRTYNAEQVPQLIIPPALVTQQPPRLVER